MSAQTRFKLLVTHLTKLLRDDPTISKLENFSPRHAETLAAAGFGYRSQFDYLRAAKNHVEHCVGYYIPDSQTIAQRMVNDLQYPEQLLPVLVRLFERAGTNDPAIQCRMDYDDDLVGPRKLISGTKDHANRERLKSAFIDALDNDEHRPLRRWFWEYIRDDNPEDHFTYELNVPRDFPSSYHLGRTISFPLTVSYDLDLGADQEASFFKYNRQLAFSGSARIVPSGLRGWRYPTFKLNETPTYDQRTDAERDKKPYVQPGEDLDDDEFEAGRAAGRMCAEIPVEKNGSLAWMAGYVLNWKDGLAWGHMSTGQSHKAFHLALDTAESLDLLELEPLRVAAEGCRHLASTRCSRQLEDAIADEIAERQAL